MCRGNGSHHSGKGLQMTPRNEASELLAGYERVVHIDEDGQFLSRVDYRQKRDDRIAARDQLPVTFVVHEAPPAKPARTQEKGDCLNLLARRASSASALPAAAWVPQPAGGGSFYK
jgi:hypothetical protein